ncbi:MAG: glycosyltransferase family 39 protein [Gammaproteobacteria bacterium]|nr:glycosyltransferase family 39 protein [Gammaproteobacteria bacterium]
MIRTLEKASPAQLATLITSYLLVHILIRLLFSQTIQLDDAEQILHAQYFALGYPIPQPPLYSWILWLLFKWFGTSLTTITLFKYSLITLTFWFTWLTARELFKHNQTILLATTSFLLMPSFAWHMHQGFTHTILLGLALSMSTYFIIKLVRAPTPLHYLLLGAALGIGIMAKYSFIIFLVAVSLSMLFSRHYRKLLLSRWTIITLITAIVVVAPHLWWVLDQNITGAVQGKLQITNSSGITERFSSLLSFAGNAIAFIIPLIIFYLITFRRLFFPIRFKLTHHNPHLELLNYFHAIMLITPIVLSLFVSMPDFKIRWFHPIMIISPLWILLLAENHKDYLASNIRPILFGTIAITVAILTIRLLQVTVGPDLGHYSRLNRPIIESLQQLPPFSSDRLLVSNDHFLGAHLLVHYPQNPIMIGEKRYRFTQAHAPVGPCILFWENDTPPNRRSLGDELATINQITYPVGQTNYSLYWVEPPMQYCD